MLYKIKYILQTRLELMDIAVQEANTHTIYPRICSCIMSSYSLLAKIEGHALLRFEELEVRTAAEPAREHASNDWVRDRALLRRDLDGLASGVGQELHLAGLLQRDEEMDCRLNVGGAD